MALKLVTDAASEPVTRAEAALFMRYTGSLQNDVIDSLIVAATRYVQNWCNTQFVNATFEYYTDSFDCGIDLPIGPISSVSSITYQDLDDATQTLATTVYGTDLISPVNKIFLKQNQSWPSVLEEPNSIKVSFTAGYGATAADTPDAAKTAIKMVGADMFEHREAQGEGVKYEPNQTVMRMMNIVAQNYRF